MAKRNVNFAVVSLSLSLAILAFRLRSLRFSSFLRNILPRARGSDGVFGGGDPEDSTDLQPSNARESATIAS